MPTPKVYYATEQASAQCPSKALDGTLRAAQAYVDEVVQSDTFRFLSGSQKIKRVWVHEAARAIGGEYWKNLGMILGREVLYNHEAIADPWVILHELAHALVPGDRKHDTEFAYRFHTLVREWLGEKAAEALKQAYFDHGVRLAYTRI